MKCQGKTLEGKKCKNPVTGRKKYCHHHSRSYSYGKKKMSKSACRKKLSKKIKINLKEGWKSRKQAVAVSYSQVKKKHPSCKKYF